MKRRAMLCVDPFTERYPQTIGLPAEDLEGQDWLCVATEAEEAREALTGDPGISEVWVVGSDNMEAINLAAALKADSFSTCAEVYLVSEEMDGELPLHAQAAGLDGMLSYGMFAKKYEEFRLTAFHASGKPPIAEGMQKATATQRKGVLLPVVSSTGGSGKSSIAVLAAIYTAQQGMKTLLVDADFQFGDVADVLGISSAFRQRSASPHTYDEVLDGTIDFEELAGYVPYQDVNHVANLTVLAALKKPQRAEECAEGFGEFLAEVLPRFDAVVVNTGAMWTEVQAVLAERAPRVVFVLDQRPASLRAATKAFSLCRSCGIATGSFVMALNRSGRGALYTKMDVGCVLGSYDVREIADGGGEVEELMASGNPQGLFVARNPMAMSVAALVDFVLKGDADEPAEAEAGLAAAAKKLLMRWRKGEERCPF